MADKGSYVSRFFVKLVEIMAAAVATAVSGYLVAHLSGYLPPQLSGFLPSQMHAPAPVAVQTTPNQSSVTKTVSAPPAPAVTDVNEQRVASPQDVAAGQPAKKSAKAAPAHKQAKTEANAAPRETADGKSREAEDKESVEARVRAALANVDANKPASAVGPPRPAEGPQPLVTGGLPRQADVPPAAPNGVAAPRAADLGPQPNPQVSLQSPAGPAAPVPPAPVQPPVQAAPLQPAAGQADPLTTVEIKSRPVATVDEAAPASEPPPSEERGLLSALKHMIPDLRRPVNAGDPPRPPAPVGE